MRYGSVCSGIGGCASAWHPIGWETQFFSEIEPFPSAVLAHHHPTIPNLGDFTKIGTESNGIELLVGGTPCQSFSIAGLRKGMDDERGNLALEFIRLAYRSGARWVVWENVPGVLSSSKGRDFGCFLSGLAGVDVPIPAKGWKNSGIVVGGSNSFSLAWRVLDAQYFGVPQRRRRVFVVGHLGDWRAAAAVLLERNCLQGHPAPSRKTGEDITGTIGAHTGRSIGAQDAACGHIGTFQNTGQGWWNESDVATAIRTPEGSGSLEANIVGSTDVARTLMAKHTKHDPELESYVMTLGHTESNGLGIYESETANTLEAVSSSNQAVAMRMREGCDGGGKGPLLSEEQSLTLAANTNDQTIFQPMAVTENMRSEVRLTEYANAVTKGGGKPGQGHQVALTDMAVRRLTPKECERLQGFKDDYTLVPYKNKLSKDGHRYKALGNSWAVPVVRWIGRRIEEVDKIKGTG